jgi:hypothetical protein
VDLTEPFLIARELTALLFNSDEPTDFERS